MCIRDSFSFSGKAFPSPVNKHSGPNLFKSKTTLNETLRLLNDYMVTKKNALLIAILLALLFSFFILSKCRFSQKHLDRSVDIRMLETSVKEAVFCRWLRSGHDASSFLTLHEGTASRLYPLGMDLSLKEEKMLVDLFSRESGASLSSNNKKNNHMPSQWHKLLRKIS